MANHATLCIALVVLVACVVSYSPAEVHASIPSLCQRASVSSTYPTQVAPNQQIQVTTIVSGSCTSDGEDYFSVRIDLVDNASGSILSANSAKIGYNATSFNVTVRNSATTPATDETWALQIDAYLIQAGGVSGQNLLNSTTTIIQVDGAPLPEFSTTAPILLAFVFGISVIALRRKQRESINSG